MSTRHLSATAQRDAARRNRYEVLHERNLLLALVAQQYPAHIAPAQSAKADYDQMRWVVCVHTPLGHLAWKISEDERHDVFAHLPDAPDDWVAHTHADKIEMLETLVAQLPRPKKGRR